MFGCIVNVLIEVVESLFSIYVCRRLDISVHENSPVHRESVNQIGGCRNFMPPILMETHRDLANSFQY